MRFKKGLSLVLSLIMLAQMCLPVGAVVANQPDADPGTAEIVCNHHNQHTAECGYTAEGGACTFDPANCPDCNLQPEKPVEPTVPEVPGKPTVPEKPVAPEKPAKPTVPEVPAKPEAPLEPLAPALGAPKAFDGTISIGSERSYITITDTGYKWGSADVESEYIGPYTLKGTANLTNALDHITVKNSGDKPIDITLDNVDIQFNNEKKCPLSIEKGAVNLTLLGNNKLTGSLSAPGLRVKEGASLTITPGSTGVLTATGGKSGAGIGSEDGTGVGEFYPTGNAVVFASSIVTQNSKDTWNGMIFEGGAGTIYGSSNSFTLPCNVTIPDKATLTIYDGMTLTIPPAFTLQNNGEIIVIDGGKIVGTVSGKPPLYRLNLDIGGADKSIAITDTGYKIGAAGEETPYEGTYILTGKVTSSQALNYISVQNKAGKPPIDITLKNVDIQVPNPNNCPFSIDEGSVNLTLEGTNVLKGGSGKPALRVEEGKSLTITAESAGSLTAVGGYGAAGIGCSNGGTKGSFSATGSNAVIFASSISDNSQSAGWKGMIFEGSRGAIYGTNNFTLPCNVTIPSGSILNMNASQVLIIPEGKTLTVDGYIYKNRGTIHNLGNIVYSGNILPSAPIDISNGDIFIGSSSCGGNCPGHAITGTTTKNKIVVNGGTHNITLLNASIVTHESKLCAFAVVNNSTVNLTLLGTSTLYSGNNYAGLAVREGNKLIITEESTGTLNSEGGFYGAGIGGDYADKTIHHAGTITIKGGTVNAEGGRQGAGIGGGSYSSGGYINIEGGTVTGIGCDGAGIGSGYKGVSSIINISGGMVTADGKGRGGAGIGSGGEGGRNYITITGGTVNATAGGPVSGSHCGGGAGIGGGWQGEGCSIRITGGTVTAKGSPANTSGGAGIGSGYIATNNNTDITIEGGTVDATGIYGGAGIGGGDKIGAGNIVITGGKVTARGGFYEYYKWGGAGIGGGNKGKGGSVRIYGGEINAIGAQRGAGIGFGSRGQNVTVAITGGKVNATGGEQAAGIGSAHYSYGGDIVTINGGTVIATGGEKAAGIGSGYDSYSGSVTINGNAFVFATKGSGARDHIGNAEKETGASVRISRGVVFEGDSGRFYDNYVSMEENTTLPWGKNLTIPRGKTLTLYSGKTLTNNANLVLDGGTIDGSGKIDGNGTFKATMVSGDIVDIPDQGYTGKAITPDVTLKPRNIYGKDFEVLTNGFTKSYDNNVNLGTGTAKVRYTRYGYPTAEKSFNIVKSGTTFDGGIKVYNGTTETTKFTYGDTVTVKVKPKATGVVANGFALMAEPASNQMALYRVVNSAYNEQICEPVNPGSDGMYTMTYNTAKKHLKLGNNTIIARYVGSDNMADFSQTVTVELKVKLIKAEVTGIVTKVYDGTRYFTNVPLTLIGMAEGDGTTTTAYGNAATANVGTSKFKPAATPIIPGNFNYYNWQPFGLSGDVTITPATPTVSFTATKKDNSLLLTATSGGVKGEKPDGTVVFTHGNSRAVIATVSTVNGVASYQWSNPPAGDVTVKANFGASSSNYKSDVVTDEATVKLGKQEQALLTINPVIGKIYGDGSFALSTTGGSGNGAVTYTVTSGDAFTVSGNTATIVKPGTVTLTATKAGDSNYEPITSAEITISIRKKPVTVTVTAQNKVYDGTDTAKVNYIVSGTVGTDTITATGAGATFADKNVDTDKTVTATGIAISGDNVGKYTLTNETATTKANITKKPLTWGASGTVARKTYDGNVTAEVDTQPILNGTLSGDTVTVTNGTVKFANANAGTHAVTATGFGINSANYSAPAGQPTFENGTINAKNVESPTVTVSGTHKFTGSQIKPAADKIVVTDNGAKISATNYTVTYGNNINAGIEAGSVIVALKGNYSGSATANFTIDKATAVNKEIGDPIMLTAADNKDYSIALPTSLEGVGALTYGATTVSSGSTIAFATDKAPKADNSTKTLTFTTANSATAEQTATVAVTVSTANYKDFTFKLTIKLVENPSVTLTGLSAATNLKYSGAQHLGYTGTVTATDGSGKTVTGLTYSYSYTGINGTNYPASTSAPTNAGSYSLLVSVANSEPKYTGIHAGIYFTIAKAPVTVTAGNYTVTKTWDGSTTAGTPDGALSVSGILNSEATVTAKPQEYPNSAVSDSHSVIVDLALTGTGSSNYVLANNTITVTGKITSGTAPVAGAPSAITVGATAITLKPVTVDGEVVEYAKNTTNATPTEGWQISTTFDTLSANTEYFFFARVAANANHGAGSASIGTLITTEKKVFEEENLGTVDDKPVTGADLLEPRSFLMPNAATKTSYLTLAEAFGTFLPTGAAFAKVTGPAEPLVMNSVAIKSGELVFTSKKNPVGFAATDVYTITMSSTDYQNFAFTMRFSASEKGNATITATLNGKEYDGAPMKEPTPSANVGSENVEFQYTYQWKRGDTALNAAPRNAGGYTLVINGSNDSLAGSLTIPFTISKKPLTVTAGNTAVISGDTPTFTFTSDGLITDETLTGVGYNCSYNKDNLDPGMARTAIIPKGGTVSSGNNNYTISYVPGTLTINPNSGALEAAIKEAEALKSSVETSNKAPNEMPYGKRFVTAEDRTAFENAIAVANQVATNAGNPQNIADAMAALAEATNAFKTAIKTGTYIYSDDDVEPSPQPTPKEHPADKFTDIKGHWAEENIRFVVEKALFNGISETLFAPDMTMTRGMLVTVLYRQAGSPKVEADKTTWYSTARAWAMKAGISDGTNMENTVTRQELVTMLHRYAKHSGIDVSVGEDTNILSYNDAFDLPQWSIPAFQWACGADIVDGISGSLLPTETATRAQVSTMLKRFAALKAK